jgi:transposase
MTEACGMRNRGGYTPAEQQRPERLRLQAAGRFARGDAISQIAHDLRVTEGSVRRWHRAWRGGGTGALRSKGPVSREKLSPQQWARLELELRKGPLAHGFVNDQRLTLGRRVYRLPAYTPDLNPVRGIWSLLKRSMANFAAAHQAGLVRIIKRKLKKIQYRPT